MHECIIWPKIIEILTSAGLSQKALATKIGVNQSTVCRLAEGTGPEPRWSVGAALIDLAGGSDHLMSAHGIDVTWFMRSTSLDQPPVSPRIATDRRNPNRPSPYTGTDIDRRAPVGEGT